MARMGENSLAQHVDRALAESLEREDSRGFTRLLGIG